jgi:phage host-nuclease inhibitor protein Gam
MVNRIKKAFTNIPTKLAEAVGFITAIAEKQRAINVAKRTAKLQIDAINAELNEKVNALKTDRDTFFNALFAFAQPQKAELTNDARSIKLESGTFGWRWTTPAVVLKGNMTDEKAIQRLEKEGFSEYVRIVKQVNREALLRDRPDISFVEYEQCEEFFAKPKLLKGEGTAEELTTEAIDRV